MHGAEQTTILKRDVLGRVTVTREQREAMLDEFERSGLKGQPFARMAGVNYQTFASWIQRRRRARGDYGSKSSSKFSERRTSGPRGQPLRLMEAMIAPPAVALPRGEHPVNQPLEVLLPGGARMHVTNAQQAALAAQLIKALHQSC